MPRRRSVLAALPALAAIPARAASPGEAEVRWRMVTEYPATAMPGEGVSFFAAAAGRASSGALTVQPGFDAPDGLRSAAMPAAVASGRVEAADAFTGALGGEAPIFALSALPFLTASAEDTRRLLLAARPAYEAALRARGLRLLYATPWPPTGLWSRAPVTGLESLRGLRVRSYDAPGTAVLRAVGAAPEQISFADAQARLRAGDLDAVLSSGDGGAGARLWEQLPHFTVLDYASPLSLAFCAESALRALPEAVGAAALAAGRDTEARQFDALRGRVASNEARMRDNGVRLAPAEPTLRAALAEAAAPVLAAWRQRAGDEGGAILDAYRRG